jgi:hypothetical protein
MMTAPVLGTEFCALAYGLFRTLTIACGFLPFKTQNFRGLLFVVVMTAWFFQGLEHHGHVIAGKQHVISLTPSPRLPNLVILKDFGEFISDYYMAFSRLFVGRTSRFYGYLLPPPGNFFFHISLEV